MSLYRAASDGRRAEHSGAAWPSSFQKLAMRKVVEAQEAERRRIARDIHDETEQLLGSAILRLDMCLTQGPDLADVVREELGKVREVLIETVQGLQELSHSLRPSLLDDLGLEASLAWLFRTRGLKESINLRWGVSGLACRLPEAVETALFRIIQEACTNVVKHAGARNLHVGLRVNHRQAIALIRDDGAGFDANARLSWLNSGDGIIAMGLGGMKERAELMGGSFILRSSPGKGTRVVAVIPLSSKRGRQ